MHDGIDAPEARDGSGGSGSPGWRAARTGAEQLHARQWHAHGGPFLLAVRYRFYIYEKPKLSSRSNCGTTARARQGRAASRGRSDPSTTRFKCPLSAVTIGGSSWGPPVG